MTIADCKIWVTALAIDPENPSTIYAGTLEDGLLKSTDAGKTWTPVGELRITGVSSVLIDPANTLRIWVGTHAQYIHRSADGGQTWELLNSGLVPPPVTCPCVLIVDVTSLAIDPSPPTILFAVVGSALYKTENGEKSWSPTNFAGNTRISAVSAIVITPIDPRTIYVSATDFGNPRRFGIFRSSDRGETWTATAGAPPTDVFSLAVDPFDSSVLYAGTRVGVYKSTDGGDIWRAANAGLPIRPPRDFPITGITVNQNIPSTLFAAADYLRTFRSTDRGESWTAIQQGLDVAAVSSVVIDPVHPPTLYAVARPDVFKSMNSGDTWERSFDLGDRPYIVSLDPKTVLVGMEQFRSSDGSSGFFLLLKGTGFAPGSTVLWNGSPRRTTFLSCVRLMAVIPVSDVAAAGTAAITVVNPALAAGTSNAVAFSIVARDLRAPLVRVPPRRNSSSVPPRSH